jgi:hypothetical protein
MSFALTAGPARLYHLAGRDLLLQNAAPIIPQDRHRGEQPFLTLLTQWEILGELALRLHHKEEAKDAFQRCLESKFSARALLKLLEVYANEGDLAKALNAAVRLTAYHHRWYMDSAYPSMVAHNLYKLGLVHGHAKIQYTLLSLVSECDGAGADAESAGGHL